MEMDGEGAAAVPHEPAGQHAAYLRPAGRQPVTVLEELLAARGERPLHAAVLLAGPRAPRRSGLTRPPTSRSSW